MAPTPEPTSPSANSWSAAEDEKLQRALGKFSASVENRWGLIAEEVGSRNKEQCKKRQKALELQLKKQEKSPQGSLREIPEGAGTPEGAPEAVEPAQVAQKQLNTLKSVGAASTPLVVAAQYGELMCAHLLIRSGADVHAVDENGDNALHWVAYKGHYEFVELLVNGIGQPPKDQTAESHAKAIDSADNFGQTVRPKRPCSTARSALGSLTGSERAVPVCRRCTLRLCDATRGCWCGCSASARTRACGTGRGATLQRRRARSSPTPTLGSACCSSGACA